MNDQLHKPAALIPG